MMIKYYYKRYITRSNDYNNHNTSIGTDMNNGLLNNEDDSSDSLDENES
jgi:hypothetical protein